MPLSLLQQLEALWESSDSPPDVFELLKQNNAAEDHVLAVLLADQRYRWQTASPLRVEDYLARLPALRGVPDVTLQLAVGEFKAQQEANTAPNIHEFTSRFSDISDQLRSKLSDLTSSEDDQLDRFRSTKTYISEETIGAGQLGRYRLDRVLGEGAFGRVYLAYDEELQRQVAVKVPTEERFRKPEDVTQYLAEARTVASLNHPNIVPVYDTGRTEDGSIYVVSRFIEGCTLDDRIRQDRLSHDEAAQLLAVVAQALNHAHERRLIHRDVKPGNILLEGTDATPYVADFGLAIREEDYLKDRKLAGTPAYMSPEQARGEGHRLDGRSDVFSLGVVLYEVLTGRKPFRGSTPNELLHQVVSVAPQSPRELDDSIPPELERICLKALSKRASDRYATADELADDLLHWNQSLQPDTKELQIVPRGLRSFDAEDADFFLELLPGPRNRNGLPDSIQFWKTRIEETDPDRTFSVGLIYGPSGCGKSSLVKAGLLPRLSKQVTAIYVESTPDETETRILRRLRRALPQLPQDLGLVDTFSLLRRAQGTKIIVIIDQFEQWLHAHLAQHETELVAALRQCDGGSLQAVVMVRDDFAMPAARFMDMIDIPILQGHNFATVDLFDADHAEKVLIRFGQAFGRLPAQSGRLTDGEQLFVRSVASGLAPDGKVVSVRLALFAEMVKGKPWIPATLEEVGGTEGIGVNFLEETFSSRTANPRHRLHQQAARKVLKALLPEVGSDIKRNMRSYGELLEASGYQNQPADFNDLLRILDGDVRLIAPTTPEGFQTESDSDPGSKFYQLTHDYLVHPLRDWLTSKQKESRQGRAELKLAERAALWNARPENRHLPSLMESIGIRTLTEKKKWTRPQRKMMAKALKFHGLRSGLVLAALIIVVFAGLRLRHGVIEHQKDAEATQIAQGLLKADTSQVKVIIESLAHYRQYVSDDLRQAFEELPDNSSGKLHAALAMLPQDKSVLPFLKGRLLKVTPQQFGLVRDLLTDDSEKLIASYWQTAKAGETPNLRFHAACALAGFDPHNQYWKVGDFQSFVVSQLVSVRPSELQLWTDALRPVREHLTDALSAIYRDKDANEQLQYFATDILADYCSDDPDRLFNLLADSSETQFETIFSKLDSDRQTAVALGRNEVTKSPSADAGEADKEAMAIRKANAAVMLMRMEAAEYVWPLLTHSSDPRVRSYIIHWLNARGADPKALIERYEQEPDVTVKRALLLCLGEFELNDSQKEPFIEKLTTAYLNDPDAGLHGAAEWLLQQWSVTLPDPPIGEPTVGDAQKSHIAQRMADIDNVQQRIAAANRNLIDRQSAWELQMRQQSADLPASLAEGLTAYYPFDEGEEQVTANATAGRPPGAFAGEGLPEWVPGVIGQAVRLKGDADFTTDSKVSVNDSCDLSFGCWFKCDDIRGTVLISNEDPENGFRGIEMGVYRGDLEVMISSGESGLHNHTQKRLKVRTRAPAGFPQNYWQHLFATYDGSGKAGGITLYLNGVMQVLTTDNDSLEGSFDSDVSLRIGGRSPGNYRFIGAIDDVRIYNRCLTDSEVQLLYTDGLRSLAENPMDTRTPEQQGLLSTAYRPQDETLNALARELAAAELALDQARWNGTRKWYVNSQGQTFALLDADEFRMGSPETEDGHMEIEWFHRRRIGRRIAIATKEVTHQQWRMFSQATPQLGWKSDQEQLMATLLTDDSPISGMTWYEAAWYCNWLSEQEGIPRDQWCYETNDKGQYDSGMKPKQNFWQLTGYRLPTEAEWEYACRAGTSTSRYYGVSNVLLPFYAWYMANGADRTHPVARLKPNDFGLFDMQGNVYEWCFDPDYRRNVGFAEDETVPDMPSLEGINTTVHRMLRGGAFTTTAPNVRSAGRGANQPGNRNTYAGFRPARTYILSP